MLDNEIISCGKDANTAGPGMCKCSVLYVYVHTLQKIFSHQDIQTTDESCGILMMYLP